MNPGPTGLVYRDSAALRPQSVLVDALLAELGAAHEPEGVVASLLAAGALEAALADAADPLAPDAARITHAIARAFVTHERVAIDRLRAGLECWRSGRLLRTSVPEGFAYSALSPRIYATAAAALLPGPTPVLVLGIRTIGATLSAVAQVALAQSGHRTRRLTVRPRGHPHNRTLVFEPAELEAVARAREVGAHFVITDEGPGLSGSSFLSVAEALVARGVPSGRITLLGTRPVDPQQLLAEDAARRFRRFRYCCAGEGQPWHGASEHDLSAGKWRARLRPGLPPVPAWPEAERRKTLSRDGRVLRKFAGLGPFGRAVYERGLALAEEGFIPRPLTPPDPDGFVRHAFVPGRPMSAAELTPALAAHLGRYLAARTRLPVPPVEGDPESRLRQMVRVNVALELGERVVAPALPAIERLVVADGHLMPHEWVGDGRGGIVKTDALDHGDDHFFPGPTDPAWDLAGATVEWHLEGPALEAMLTTYRGLTGDDAGNRLPGFLIAYAAFRARLCVMAAHGCGEADADRWRQAHCGYTEVLRSALQQAPGCA